MLPSVNEDALATVFAEVAALEHLCTEIEAGLRERNPERVRAAINGSRRAAHALENAMHALGDNRTEAFDREVSARLRRVYDARAVQIARLEAYRDAIGERLQSLSNWKQYARSIGGPKQSSRVSLLDDRR